VRFVREASIDSVRSSSVRDVIESLHTSCREGRYASLRDTSRGQRRDTGQEHASLQEPQNRVVEDGFGPVAGRPRRASTQPMSSGSASAKSLSARTTLISSACSKRVVRRSV